MSFTKWSPFPTKPFYSTLYCMNKPQICEPTKNICLSQIDMYTKTEREDKLIIQSLKLTSNQKKKKTKLK